MYKIMIADDEAIVRKGLVNLVNWDALDCEIIFQADDGATVLEHLENIQPDILICDIKMPRVDGIGVAQYIYEHHIPTKVIILTGFADFSYAKSAIKYNVVDYITKANALEGIGDAVEKAKLLIEKDKVSAAIPNIAVLQTNFLKSVIDGSLLDSDIPTGFWNYDISLEDYQVISIQFLINDKFTQIEKNKFYISILNFFGMSFTGYQIHQIPFNKEHFCIIVHHLSDLNSNSLKKVCNNLADTLGAFMHLNVIIGISSRFNDPSDLASAYQQADLFSNTFFMDHSQNVFCAADGASFSQSVDMKQLKGIIDNLSFELQKGTETEVYYYLEQLFTIQSHAGMDIIKSTGITVINLCDKLLSPYDTTVQVKLHNPHIISDLLSCTLFMQYKEIITSVVEMTSRHLQNYAQNRNKLVLNTLEYIDQHYQNNITLLDIADAVHMNSSYLSRTFKEHTGTTIIATLNKKKLDRAKELLLTSDMKIYEIAESIGMNDTTYFSHFFKKNLGVTPKEFKENNSFSTP